MFVLNRQNKLGGLGLGYEAFLKISVGETVRWGTAVGLLDVNHEN